MTIPKPVLFLSVLIVGPIAERIGEIVARLHSAGLIHGDLTTSNIMTHLSSLLSNPQMHVTLIDFGLASVSSSAEDRAVDLYVLERALVSTHPLLGVQMFRDILAAYEKQFIDAAPTLKKLAEVQLRGRKRSMVG